MSDSPQAGFDAREQRNANPDRLLAFTDGVFAIIITILVLELKVPDLTSGQSLREALVEIRPTFVSFIISFLLVGMYWVGHRSSFTQVRYIDRNTIWLNLLFLLPVAIVPFAAGLLGEYQSEPTALHLYGLVLIAATLLRLALDSYIYRHPGLLWQEPSKGVRRVARIATGAPLVAYAIAMIVATWVPWLSLLLYFSIPLFYFVFVTVLKADPRTRVDAEDLS
ncbi:MAG: TMEM175 family protein [Actinomycetota bacterium]|nr:TMEM175 family protein [Actinomycetota bacterium]